MSLVADIASYLRTEGFTDGGWAIGEQRRPEAPGKDKAICLFQYAGQSPMGEGGLTKPGIQIVVRGAKDQGHIADDKIHAIFDRLNQDDLAPLTMGASDIRAIWAQQSPFFLEYDTELRPVWAVNFIFGLSR